MKRTLLKATVSLALLAWILCRIDVGTALSLFQNLSPVWIATALALGVGGFLISALKWSLLPGVSGSFFHLLKLFWIGAFFNNLLPGRTGGDLVRAYGISRNAPDKIGAALTVALDRGLNLVALVVLALVALLAYPQGLPALARQNLLLALGLFSMTGILAILLIPAIAHRFSEHTRIRRLLDGTTAALTGLLQRPVCTMQTFVLALLYQSAVILVNYAVARALGLQIEPAIFFYLIPVTALVTMAPVTLNGFGLRESAYAFVFTRAGVSAESAVAISLGATLCMIVLSLVGGIFYATGRTGIQPATTSTAHS
ncbi:MAG: lysylphosphatidylglycerol synthase transmembrane domain-containing protein [bacterium]|nr:lysylphosphatidylglycerol synthase transmembrane domain-containing protein [bacterium]